MSEKKSDKKNQHILAINQVLAEFDIQTQVRRITLETMDSFMKGNKQAFEYIKESEKKFIDFESRLCKAENYYKNMQANINAKIEVTNLLNERLSSFTEKFYSGMQETENSVQQMRKNYISITRESGNQNNTIKNHDKDIEYTKNRLLNLSDRIDEEVGTLMNKINEVQEKAEAKISQRKRESENILMKLSQAKSVLESKSALLSNTLKDMSLYKEEKIAIQSQIEELHEEMKNRVVKAEFYEMRKHFDNASINEKERVNAEFQRIEEKINNEEEKREKQDKIVSNKIQQTNKLLESQIKDVRRVAEKNLQSLKSEIEQSNKRMEEQFNQKQQIINKNIKSIEEIETTLVTINKRIMVLEEDTAHKTNQIIQIQSNIHSMNTLISSIEAENIKRAQSLAKLQVDSEEQGDIGEQMKKFGEKIMGMDQILRNHESGIEENKDELETMKKNVGSSLKNLQNSFVNLSTKEQEEVREIKAALKQAQQVLDAKIDEKYEDSLRISEKNLNEQMDSIKDKFEFLVKISQEISAFKQDFQKQISTHQEINKEIKEKMEKIFSMFTKLKSDFFIKLQALNQDHQKSVQKIKQSSKNIESFSKLMTEINQLLTICLSANLQKQYQEEKDKTGHRIASILQGWVIEIDEKEKFKYRGEVVNRKILLQVALEHFVKSGDKIKGGIIEQGKEVFQRMVANNDEIQYHKKRPVSRGRRSELPKVYR